MDLKGKFPRVYGTFMGWADDRHVYTGMGKEATTITQGLLKGLESNRLLNGSKKWII